MNRDTLMTKTVAELKVIAQDVFHLTGISKLKKADLVDRILEAHEATVIPEQVEENKEQDISPAKSNIIKKYAEENGIPVVNIPLVSPPDESLQGIPVFENSTDIGTGKCATMTSAIRWPATYVNRKMRRKMAAIGRKKSVLI